MAEHSPRVQFRTTTPIVRNAIARWVEAEGCTPSEAARQLLELGALLVSPLGIGVSPHVCELMTDGVGRAAFTAVTFDSVDDAAAALAALERFGWDQSPESLQRLASGQLQVISTDEQAVALAAIEAAS